MMIAHAMMSMMPITMPPVASPSPVYIGFDAISTAAEETVNPQRNLPIGILGGLGICTVIYVIVGAVLTGMVNYKELDPSVHADPLAYALQAKKSV